MKKMISPEEALAEVLQHSRPLPAREVPLAEACGCVLDGDICADRDYPPFDRAMMDGYACCVSDAGSAVPVAGEVAAGQMREEPLEARSAIRIMTGAPCPPGTEMVVPVEQVARSNGHVQLPALLVPRANIARRGSECSAGDTVAQRGTVVTPLIIANLASFGYSHVRVIPRPSCHLITTGSEIVRDGAPVAPGQIRDSNGPMVEAMLRELDIPFSRTHADDTASALHQAIEEAAHADVVLLTGGVSAGDYDLVPGALEAAGVQPVFHKVRQKPGKPLYFGQRNDTLFFGLPGNPLAVHLCFHRYVAPALRARMGHEPIQAAGMGQLTDAVIARGERTHFRLCRAIRVGADTALHPLSGKGSADIYAVAGADAYIAVPPGPEGLPTHAEVAFEPIGDTP